MRVFFNSQEIIDGHTSAVKRAIRRRLKDDPHLKYKFSGPFSDLEEALYDLRSGFISWFRDNYSFDIQNKAVQIEYNRLNGGVKK